MHPPVPIRAEAATEQPRNVHCRQNHRGPFEQRCVNKRIEREFTSSGEPSPPSHSGAPNSASMSLTRSPLTTTGCVSRRVTLPVRLGWGWQQARRPQARSRNGRTLPVVRQLPGCIRSTDVSRATPRSSQGVPRPISGGWPRCRRGGRPSCRGGTPGATGPRKRLTIGPPRSGRSRSPAAAGRSRCCPLR